MLERGGCRPPVLSPHAPVLRRLAARHVDAPRARAANRFGDACVYSCGTKKGRPTDGATTPASRRLGSPGAGVAPSRSRYHNYPGRAVLVVVADCLAGGLRLLAGLDGLVRLPPVPSELSSSSRTRRRSRASASSRHPRPMPTPARNHAMKTASASNHSVVTPSPDQPLRDADERQRVGGPGRHEAGIHGTRASPPLHPSLL